MVQGKIDAQPQEKALQASAEEKVAFSQLGIRQGSVAEAVSEAIDLSTFKAKDFNHSPFALGRSTSGCGPSRVR